MEKFKFSNSDYQKELIKELAMREKVWTKVQGFKDRFTDQTKQKRYDILEELLLIIEMMPPKLMQRLQDNAIVKLNEIKAQKDIFDQIV